MKAVKSSKRVVAAASSYLFSYSFLFLVVGLGLYFGYVLSQMTPSSVAPVNSTEIENMGVAGASLTVVWAILMFVCLIMCAIWQFGGKRKRR